MDPKIIAVGIPTDGAPCVEEREGYAVLRNQLIGLGFHWQRTIETLLPGEIELTEDPVYTLINRLPLETYLESVVGSEMNPDAPPEFLKAHAVISRGWAMGKITGMHPHDESGKKNEAGELIDWEDTCDHQGFDVCSDDHCQRYQGIQPLDPRVLEAIRSTAGQCLYSADGHLVDTRFSKCCGGRTELFSTCWQDRDEPCLESFEDPWCDLSGMRVERQREVLSAILKDYDLMNDGGYSWDTLISEAAVRENLRRKFGRDIGHIRDMEITERGPSGRAKKILLKGEAGELTLGKELMIRRLLAPSHLYSSAIEITKDLAGGSSGDNPDTSDTTVGLGFRIHGRGWGHGVGLCQIGAARMAMEGHSFEEILSFYYPGSVLC